jgi:hypothetical protein
MSYLYKILALICIVCAAISIAVGVITDNGLAKYIALAGIMMATFSEVNYLRCRLLQEEA